MNQEKTIIKVMGVGCDKCHDQLKYVEEAVAELKLDADIEYITDLQTIIRAGIMQMPGIVVDGKVVSKGKVLLTDEVKALLEAL